MEYELRWLTEDEGEIVFVEQKKEIICLRFFIISEEEAELKLYRLGIVDTNSEIVDISSEIISKMTECILESFRLLWEKGYEETILVEQKGSFLGKILNSTGVVQKVYSEYMMCYTVPSGQYIIENSDSQNNFNNIYITEEEDGLACKNAEETFFCRLLPYEGGQDGVRSYYLYEVEVSEAVRNQGIATACLKELFVALSREAAGNQEDARNCEGASGASQSCVGVSGVCQNPVKILLQVGSYNEPAVHLYEKLGFGIYEELCCYAPVEA